MNRPGKGDLRDPSQRLKRSAARKERMMEVVNYEERFGEIRFPEGFEKKLEGKEPEEQMKCFRITETSLYARTAYGQTEKEVLCQNSYALEEYSKFKGVVIKDKIIVGVLIEAWGPEHRTAVCLPDKKICVSYASDNEGSGTKDRTDYACLICV